MQSSRALPVAGHVGIGRARVRVRARGAAGGRADGGAGDPHEVRPEGAADDLVVRRRVADVAGGRAVVGVVGVGRPAQERPDAALEGGVEALRDRGDVLRVVDAAPVGRRGEGVDALRMGDRVLLAGLQALDADADAAEDGLVAVADLLGGPGALEVGLKEDGVAAVADEARRGVRVVEELVGEVAGARVHRLRGIGGRRRDAERVGVAQAGLEVDRVVVRAAGLVREAGVAVPGRIARGRVDRGRTR